MLRTKCLLLCISFCILGIKANIAPFVTPCRWQDGDCILKSAKVVLPYLTDGVLGIPPADPLVLDDVVADNGDLKLRFFNTTVSGMKNCNIAKITRNEQNEKSSGSLILECPFIITGLYLMDGKILFVNAKGDGQFEFKSDKIRIIVDISLKKFNAKDGKKHYKVSSFQYKYEPIERIHINLENMFNGDKSQAESILALLNENWEVITNSLGMPLFKESVTKTIHNVDLFFRKIPAEELEIV